MDDYWECEHWYYHGINCPDCDDSSPVTVLDHLGKITNISNQIAEIFAVEDAAWHSNFAMIAEMRALCL